MSDASVAIEHKTQPHSTKEAAYRSARQVAWIFNIYRFCLSVLLLLFYHVNVNFSAAGHLDADLFLASASIYLAFSILALLTTEYQSKHYQIRLIFQALSDIILLGLMMYGASSRNGFAVMLSVAIAGNSLLLGGRIAYVLALTASATAIVGHCILNYPEIRFINLFSETGLLTATFLAIALISVELSQRVQAGEKLASLQSGTIEQLAKLNSQIISRLHAGAIVVSPTGEILIMNDMCKQLFPQTSTGPHTLAECHASLSQWLHDWQQRQDNEPSQIQRVTLSNNEYDCRFYPLNTDTQANTLILLEDHTRTAQQAQQLKLASLGQFTASIAHEIRNPVGAISHAAQLLSESESLNQEDRQLAEIIHKHTERVNRVIKNVLQLSRRHESHAQWLSCSQWIEQFIQASHFPEYDGVMIELKLTNPEAEQREIFFDASQLQQILMNLCSNGLRYSMKKTGVAHCVFCLGWDENRSQLTLDIIDEGDGISEEKLARLFEPFYTTERQGTGLGLYLAKELCELNRASLHYERDAQYHYFRLTFLETR